MDPYQEKLLVAGLSLVSALLTALITSRLRPRARIYASQPHTFTFSIPGNENSSPFLVFTKSLLIQNSGRGIAKNIEVCFLWRPANIKIWPPQEYEEKTNPENFFFIKIPSMTSNSQLIIEMLSAVQQLPDVLSVRHEDGDGKFISVFYQRAYPNWVKYAVISLMTLGVGAIFYIFYSIVINYILT